MSEFQSREWKQTWCDEHLKWIRGFANIQGRVLEIGKDDQAEVVGLKNSPWLLEGIVSKALSLGIVVGVNLQSGKGDAYPEVGVHPYLNPISSKGRYDRRSGCTLQILSGFIDRFLLRKHGGSCDDALMPGFSLKDVDRGTLSELRRLGVVADRVPGRVSLGRMVASGALNKTVRRLVFGQRPPPAIPDKPGSRLQKYRLTDQAQSDLGGSDERGDMT